MKRSTAVIVAVALASPAFAEEAPVDPEIARLQAETARLNAQSARDTARAGVTTAATARLQAQIDALGLPKPEGKTTMGTNAGVIETWMLSASTLDAAARAIVGEVAAAAAPPPTDRPDTRGPGRRRNIEEAAAEEEGGGSARPTYLLLAGEEALNLDAANNLLFQTTDLTAKLQAAIPQQCLSKAAASGEDGGAVPIAAIGALVGLLKTDTEISGIDITLGDRMLVAAVGRRLARGADVILPAAAIAPPAGGALAGKWQALASAQGKARTCRINFAKNKPTSWVKKKLAALDQAIGAIDALDAKVTKPDDAGRIPLAQAIRYDALLQSKPNVLRVYVEKAGGSVVKRSNLFTALGASAVDISGGLIVHHRLTEPSSGRLLTSGVHVCRTALTRIGDVHSGRVRRNRTAGSNCAPLYPQD
ncbi:MAG TPA: hypothetical protein VF605_09410 [Allosphingosinicella sp.]|jgi:hypothetical protein